MDKEILMTMMNKELNNRSFGETFVDGILNIIPDVIVINTRPIKSFIRGTYDPNSEEKIFHTFYDDRRNPCRPTVIQVVEIVDKKLYNRIYNQGL